MGDYQTCAFRLATAEEKKEWKEFRQLLAASLYNSVSSYAARPIRLLHMDSDSIIDENAITEIMKVFNANQNVGSIAGEVKIWHLIYSTTVV